MALDLKERVLRELRYAVPGAEEPRKCVVGYMVNLIDLLRGFESDYWALVSATQEVNDAVQVVKAVRDFLNHLWIFLKPSRLPPAILANLSEVARKRHEDKVRADDYMIARLGGQVEKIVEKLEDKLKPLSEVAKSDAQLTKLTGKELREEAQNAFELLLECQTGFSEAMAGCQYALRDIIEEFNRRFDKRLQVELPKRKLFPMSQPLHRTVGVLERSVASLRNNVNDAIERANKFGKVGKALNVERLTDLWDCVDKMYAIVEKIYNRLLKSSWYEPQKEES